MMIINLEERRSKMNKEREVRDHMRKHGFERAAEEAEIGRYNIDYVLGCWQAREKLGRPMWTQIFGE